MNEQTLTSGSYFYFSQDYLVVGGTYQKWPEVTAPHPRKEDRDKILADASRIFPGIKVKQYY